MTSIVNAAAWASVYGVGLNGASMVVTATGKVGFSLIGFVIDGCRDGNWDDKRSRLWTELKTNGASFCEGFKYVGLALLIRQVVARVFGSTPPHVVTEGLANLGWYHVRSPAVEAGWRMLPDFITSRFTLY